MSCYHKHYEGDPRTLKLQSKNSQVCIVCKYIWIQWMCTLYSLESYIQMIWMQLVFWIVVRIDFDIQ